MFYFNVVKQCKYVNRAINRQLCEYSTKINYLTMNTAHFRYIPNEPNFFVSLRYVNNNVGIDKQFNFCRSIDETITSFTNRVDANINKTLQKKNKKKFHKVGVIDDTLIIKSKLLLNKVPLETDLPCSKLFNENGSFELEILGVQLQITVNAPWIENMTLHKSIMAGFLVYPAKFESYFVEKNLSIWAWYRSEKLGTSWQICGSNEIYETSMNDIGHYLKLICEPRSSDRCGPKKEVISVSVVEAGPGELPFVARQKHTTSESSDDTIRVVSYNILADVYVDSEYSRDVLFGYCPPYALELNYRRQLLLKEIIGYKTDVLCLQEVDSKVFHSDLQLLKMQGLLGCFSPKGTTSEGTAIFFNQFKLKLLKHWSLQLSDLLKNDSLFTQLLSKIACNAAFLERVMSRQTTLQISLLECIKRSGHILVVANVHLYFHPDADHVRLFQAIIIIAYLESLIKEQQHLFPGKTLSLLLCGDFNSVPECGIYKLVTEGTIDSEHADWKSNQLEAVKGISHAHELKLASACGTPEFTNYTEGFKACLDYIFYDTNSFCVEQVVPFPSVEELSTNVAIPSVVFPSDHIALASDLRFIL